METNSTILKRRKPLPLLIIMTMMAVPILATAADPFIPTESWHARSLGEAIGLTALFSAAGVLLAAAGYKLFDWLTPGQLHKEILENKNVAAAIVGAAVILGICIIIAAAMIG